MYNGIINVYKEEDYTSHDVVAKLRGILKQKKIGHTGTLDPKATGVLPVCLGCGTKLCDMLTDTSKEYEAVLLLGVETDTQDMTGQVMRQEETSFLTEEAVREAVMSFVGQYQQIPPMYSALKVEGKKLYELAREGITIERKARAVEIMSISILEIHLPEVRFLVSCSKGTYIRTLCADIGTRLGCGGAMKSLVRTRVGNFFKKDAYTLAQIEEIRDREELDGIIFPVESAFEQCRSIHVKAADQRYLENGNPLKKHQIEEKEAYRTQEQVKVYNNEDRFYGVYAYDDTKAMFYPQKMFLDLVNGIR